MSARPWYKRYGADFVFGTMGLSLEERGAYSICLDLIYDRQGPIPDDARYLAGVCGVSVRKWNSIRDRLVIVGKLHPVDGMLLNARAVIELENAAKTARKLAENGAKGGNKSVEMRQKPNENNETIQAPLKPTRGLPEPEPDSYTDTAKAVSPSAKPRKAAVGFDQFWEAYPRKVGKLAAQTAWKRLAPPLDDALAAIARYRQAKPADIDYCHPATWLNQGRWMDEHSTATGPPVTVDPARTSAAIADREALFEKLSH